MADNVALLTGRKRKRPAKTTIEQANEKTDEVFVHDLLHKSSSGSFWFPTWKHPKNGKDHKVALRSASNLMPTELQACYALVEETSKPDYEASSGGWRPRAKLKEMRLPELRYILVQDAAGVTQGFVSLMPTHEQGIPVVYCYEIHLKEELRGTGLARKLMGLLETVAENLPPVEKVMLTCFVSNHHAVAFYERLGFERDNITPDARVLRSGEIRAVDYMIMSKKIARKG